MNETEKIENPHDWDFKQEGASIYRFDQSTGEVCWIQSRPAGTALKQCPPFPPFEK
jgi:outer membrane protein assembly factor BamB